MSCDEQFMDKAMVTIFSWVGNGGTRNGGNGGNGHVKTQ